MIFSGSTSNSPKTKVVSSILFSTKPFCRLHSRVVSTHRVNIVVKYLQVKFLSNFARLLTFPAAICYKSFLSVSLQLCEIQIDLHFFLQILALRETDILKSFNQKCCRPILWPKVSYEGSSERFSLRQRFGGNTKKHKFSLRRHRQN